jgi:hypothetical protein
MAWNSRPGHVGHSIQQHRPSPTPVRKLEHFVLTALHKYLCNERHMIENEQHE